MEMPVAPGMVAPLDGTPDDQGLNGTSEGGKKNKSGGPRRKVGRWSEEETNTLISLTNQVTQLLQSTFLDNCCLSGPYAHNLFNSCTTMHRYGVIATLIVVLLAAFSLLMPQHNV